MTTPDPITMTNDEAQDWLLSLLNATPPPRDAARFGAAIRAIRAKAIADAKEWGLASQPEPLDVERLAIEIESYITEDPNAEPKYRAGKHYALRFAAAIVRHRQADHAAATPSQPEPLDVERLARIVSAAQYVVASAGRLHDTVASHDHSKCLPTALDMLRAALETPQ